MELLPSVTWGKNESIDPAGSAGGLKGALKGQSPDAPGIPRVGAKDNKYSSEAGNLAARSTLLVSGLRQTNNNTPTHTHTLCNVSIASWLSGMEVYSDNERSDVAASKLRPSATVRANTPFKTISHNCKETQTLVRKGAMNTATPEDDETSLGRVYPDINSKITSK